MSIGLAMIVRDEQTVIQRCLERVRPLIDTWTVIDTGSQDRTKQGVRRALQGIPGELHDRPWVSHQHNRNELLELAGGTADYLLLMDADLLLHIDGGLPELVDDMYLARLAGEFTHTIPLLVNGRKSGWRYKGAAHALLTNDKPFTASVLENASLEETRAESPRRDKIERDAMALEAELDPRTIYYLAQSYADLGHHEAAADMFRLRVRHSTVHPQERFWSAYREGVIRIETDFARGAAILLEAWAMRPTRAEPLWKLALEHRMRGQAPVALLYAERACAIPPTTDQHFVLAWLYEWGVRQERALCRLATGDRAGALEDFVLLARRTDEAGEFARKQISEIEERLYEAV